MEKTKLVGKRIRAARLKRGWTQKDLAEEVGKLTFQTVSNIEVGRHDATLSTVFEIARALGVPVEDLVKEE